MLNVFKNKLSQIHKQSKEAKELLRFIGPGILVTVGFIDPGNWAANLAAGADYGYALLWVVTLSTLMLILLQHNVAHLGIVTGECLSEAATRFLPKRISRPILVTAIMAAQATALAEILGAAIALNMLFGIPIMAGCDYRCRLHADVVDKFLQSFGNMDSGFCFCYCHVLFI